MGSGANAVAAHATRLALDSNGAPAGARPDGNGDALDGDLFAQLVGRNALLAAPRAGAPRPPQGAAGMRNASSTGRSGRLSHSGRRSPSGPGAGRACASHASYTARLLRVSTNTSP